MYSTLNLKYAKHSEIIYSNVCELTIVDSPSDSCYFKDEAIG